MTMVMYIMKQLPGRAAAYCSFAMYSQSNINANVKNRWLFTSP